MRDGIKNKNKLNIGAYQVRRRLTAVFLLLLVAVQTVCGGVRAEAANGPDTRAESYCVMNAKTGEVICEKNMTGRYYPASITKIMTALIVYEHVKETDLDKTLTFSHDAVVTYLTSDSSTLTPTAKEGETMSVNDALHGMIMPSGNECANALAEYVAGSMDAFVALMNDKAEELGLENTHFVNASGLDDANQYVSAYDMAVIMQEAMKNPLCAELLSCKTYTIKATNMTEARSLVAGHSMVYGDYPYEGEIAGKGGHTAAAGRTLVTYVDQGDYQLIVVVLQDELTRAFFDVQTLLDFSFSYLRGEVGEVNWRECNEEVWAKTTADVYEFANECTVKLDILTPDRIVTCVGKYDKWYMISLNGVIGYVLADQMTNGQEEPSSEPEETATKGENPFYGDITREDGTVPTAQYEQESHENTGPILTVLGADDKPVGELAVVGAVSAIGVAFAGAAAIVLVSLIKEHKRKRDK